MLFGQMTAVMKQHELYNVAKVQEVINCTKDFAKCHVVANQHDFGNIMKQAKPIKGISKYHTFIFEEGVLYCSVEMLGQKKE